jgi:hypothetical protein
MGLTKTEFDALLEDATKRIDGDIHWSDDEDHSPAVVFRAEVSSQAGYPLFVSGSFNRLALTLSYVLIHRGIGRIYGLDLGKDHHNPECTYVGEKHKHSWSELYRDKEAYVPRDITALPTEPVRVWEQFCAEARITHAGVLHDPPPVQEELL